MKNKIARQELSERLRKKFINIHMKNLSDGVDIKENPEFIKLLEDEYAAKYLEILGIDPSYRAKKQILKYHPFHFCDFERSWNTDGNPADVLKITPLHTSIIQNIESPTEELLDTLKTIGLIKVDLLDQKRFKEKRMDRLNQKSSIFNSRTPKKSANPNARSLNNPVTTEFLPVEDDAINEEKGLAKSAMKNSYDQTAESPLLKELRDVKQKSLENKLDSSQLKHSNGNQQKPVKGNRKSNDDEEDLTQFKPDFTLEQLERRYLFPFNVNLRRTNNIMLRDPDVNEKLEIEKPLHETNIFALPVNSLRIDKPILFELQKPPQIELREITKLLEIYASKFPKHIIPLDGDFKAKKEQAEKIVRRNSIFPIIEPEDKKKKPDSDKKSKIVPPRSFLNLKAKHVSSTLALLVSEEMSKFVGLFLHFTYWKMLSNLHSVPLDNFSKKQMLIHMYNILNGLQGHFRNKIWCFLTFPMILLCLKMVAEHVFKQTYGLLFCLENAGEIFLDKMFHLIERLFDQNLLYGRLVFLENNSEIEITQKREKEKNRYVFKETELKMLPMISGGNHLERKILQKRQFGLSPYVDMIWKEADSEKTRAILMKKKEMEKKDPLISGKVSKSLELRRSMINPMRKSSPDSLAQEFDQHLYQIYVNKVEKVKGPMATD